ncbi:hypothetical protein HPP92_024794 [Vanilla planifolia]|uniref:Uncharacterized protein n=1 Tax=Vanilla planifolia TaxID=51239 RepID=A0A835UA06_VANPL|nr:hypothetical protein HPP92_024794 [Vanilla planifolia]
MEEPARVSFRDGRLASRKAEEAACRRFQAALWLEKMSGPLGLPSEPTEQQFVSCLRNGLVLCNAINKIQPGAVPKVVQNQSNGLTWENQTPPAYQYFENIRNFLVAVNEFKIPSFEASDIERDNLEAGSVGKIVDCILGLKAYHEWKQFNGGNGPWKYMKSPMVSRANSIISSNMSGKGSSVKCLDMSATSERQPTIKIVDQTSEDFLVQAIADCLFNSKENIDQRIFDSWHNGTMGSVELFNKVISSCKQDQQNCHGIMAETHSSNEIKALLSRTKQEFASFQSQLQKDLVQLGFQIQELSSAAVGYHRAIKENRNLHNMLQELKGNIRVFCRVRPTFVSEEKCLIDYIGGDGTLIILDPFKTQNARKVFQFNKVFGPHVTQEEVYRETQPLIRSVMDGYNVCIFAYGQTGSGKTYTMCGPNTGSAKDVGINSKALNDLFQISCTRDDMNYDIHVQMVEIYNEQVRDLLIEETSTTKYPSMPHFGFLCFKQLFLDYDKPI